MKAIVSLAVGALCWLGPVTPGGAEPKIDLEYLQKKWALKLKSAKFSDNNTSVVLTLEFTEDIKDLQLFRKELSLGVPASKGSPVSAPIWFYCFDEDNVVIGKSYISSQGGELTGKKGDAFRISVSLSQKAKKVEVRPAEKAKK